MRYSSVFRPGLFEGHTVIVSGGGTGIGRAIAWELASLGAHVALAGRRAEPLEEVRGEVEAAGGLASAHPADVRDEEQVEGLFSAVVDARGAVTGLVNNAGGQYLSPAEDIAAKGWRAVVETNLNGTFLMCKQAYQAWMGEFGGAIVNVVSEMWRGFPGMAHSGAARAAVVNLTQTLAVEWARAGIRVNAVAPGIIRSSGLRHYGESMQPVIDQLAHEIPAKRLGTESEVSGAVTYLLSPAAAYVSGDTLRVDGGGSLWRKPWEIPDHDRAPAFHAFLEE